MIGTTLSHFKITAKLGEGGMGEVYRAEDQTLKREVALKILPAKLTRDPDRLARFRREAESLAALTHPNIVTIHSFEEAEGVHFLIMELVEGQTLDQRIPEEGLDSKELLDIAIPLTAAVAAAHEKGVIHRDLKPGNVILTPGGTVKVLDFGLAKLEDDAANAPEEDDETALMTREGMIVGTMPYMSPDQIKGQAIDVRSDVFSLGVMLYEMATGKRPFRGRGTPELMSAILKDSPPPVSDLRPQIPTPLGEVIQACLEKEPDSRPSSAGQVHDQLEELRDGMASGVVSTATAAKSNRSLLWAVTAAIAILLIAGLLWTLGGPTEPTVSTASEIEPVRVAVLPFQNPGSPKDDALGDGFAQEITLRLSGLQGIGVISRLGDLSISTSDSNLQEIGRELSADYVLSGTIQQLGAAAEQEQIEVDTQLVRVSDGKTVWSEPLEIEPGQLVATQSRIAGRVIRELDIGISDKERQRLERQPTQNPVAYEAYLRGLEALPRGHAPEEDYRKALKLFEQAVALDPDFALALAKLSEAHRSLYFMGYDHTNDRLASAWAAVERALELEPELADVRVALGYYYYQGELDYNRALAEFSKAAEDLPNDAELLRSIAYIWRRQGLFDESLEYQARSAALTPQDADVAVEYSYTLCVVGEYDQALDVLERSIAIEPELEWPYMLKALALWSRGREGDLEQARESLAQFPDPRSFYPAWFWINQDWLEGNFQSALDRIANLAHPILVLQARFAPKEMLAGLTYHYMGMEEQARVALETAVGILEREAEAAPKDARIHFGLGLALAALGRRDEALAAGQHAVELYPISEDALLGADRIWDLARIGALVGEDDLALDQIAVLRSVPTIYSPAWFRNDPSFASLRASSRFQGLVGSGEQTD